MSRPQIQPGKIDADLTDQLDKLRFTNRAGGSDETLSVFAHAVLVMEPVFVSLAVYAYVLLLCELIGRQIVTRNLPAAYQRYALEFCATLQVGACVRTRAHTYRVVFACSRMVLFVDSTAAPCT
jgi:hypothetical protein